LPEKLRSARRESTRQLKLYGDSEYRLKKKLRWISLHGVSSKYLPEDFHLHDAIAIDLKYSFLPLFYTSQVFITGHFLRKLIA